jgi:hypothetical protein
MPDLSDATLARELRDLGPWLVTPAPPDVRTAVRARLSTGTPRRSSGRWLAAAAALLVALTIAVLPPTGTAVAHAASAILRFAGIEFDSTPGTDPLPATPSPLPGIHSAALDEARRQARFPIGVPARLGPPESVQLADPDSTGAPRVVSLLYRGGTVRLDEFDGQLEPFFIKGIAVGGANWTTVNGNQAVWIPTPHLVAYVDRDGVRHEETARLAAATLIWNDTAVTYRLEGPFTLDEALAIAGSID